ncbi:uncharacterized protein LOC115415883 isoform X1 [Sphaeramia orbicularis]|uniref:uncharacterized protein LOC115415883 isoform X1 n=1 Tax=Sphaeramia orbicularis TaxID=375764 RepID=UPI00117CF723|nr:uncharacterized protein LOC115415883 isoform X1 [Sphaeramia orbicularis]
MNGMEEFQNGSEGSFNSEEAESLVKECIDAVVGGDDYSQTHVNKWTASVVERTLSTLVKQGKPYKYMGKAYANANPAGQTGEALQVHGYMCCDAENRSWTPHSQLLLLGHNHGRQLHSQMGKPNHVLCGQCVRRGHPIIIPADAYCSCPPVTSRGSCNSTGHTLAMGLNYLCAFVFGFGFRQ